MIDQILKNYCPVRLLNIFLKICKQFLHENLTNYIETFLSKIIPLIASPIINLPYARVWNTVVTSGLVPPVAIC